MPSKEPAANPSLSTVRKTLKH